MAEQNKRDNPVPGREAGEQAANPTDAAIDDAMAVDSLPDEVRTHAGGDETETVQRNVGGPEPAED